MLDNNESRRGIPIENSPLKVEQSLQLVNKFIPKKRVFQHLKYHQEANLLRLFQIKSPDLGFPILTSTGEEPSICAECNGIDLASCMIQSHNLFPI
jgi:hypothetical protein